MLAVSLQRFLQVMNALARLCNLRQVYLCVCVCARVCVPGQFFRCKVFFFFFLWPSDGGALLTVLSCFLAKGLTPDEEED